MCKAPPTTFSTNTLLKQFSTQLLASPSLPILVKDGPWITLPVAREMQALVEILSPIFAMPANISLYFYGRSMYDEDEACIYLRDIFQFSTSDDRNRVRVRFFQYCYLILLILLKWTVLILHLILFNPTYAQLQSYARIMPCYLHTKSSVMHIALSLSSSHAGPEDLHFPPGNLNLKNPNSGLTSLQFFTKLYILNE